MSLTSYKYLYVTKLCMLYSIYYIRYDTYYQIEGYIKKEVPVM